MATPARSLRSSGATSAAAAASSSAANPRRQTWWDVDSSSGRRPAQEPKTGAALLVERCKRSHGWTHAFATNVLDGYKVFLESKLFMHDWDAQRLSPSIPVGQMWHAHILDTKNYANDCEMLFGRVLHHDPDGMFDTEAKKKKKRVAAMRDLLKTRIGEYYDEKVWDFGTDDDDDSRKRARTATGRAPQSSSHETGSSLQEEGTSRVTIRLGDQTGNETFYRIWRSTRMGLVFRNYAQRKGVQRRDLRFVLDGVRVDDDMTPQSLALDDLELIDVRLE